MEALPANNENHRRARLLKQSIEDKKKRHLMSLFKRFGLMYIPTTLLPHKVTYRFIRESRAFNHVHNDIYGLTDSEEEEGDDVEPTIDDQYNELVDDLVNNRFMRRAAKLFLKEKGRDPAERLRIRFYKRTLEKPMP